MCRLDAVFAMAIGSSLLLVFCVLVWPTLPQLGFTADRSCFCHKCLGIPGLLATCLQSLCVCLQRHPASVCIEL